MNPLDLCNSLLAIQLRIFCFVHLEILSFGVLPALLKLFRTRNGRNRRLPVSRSREKEQIIRTGELCLDIDELVIDRKA